MFPVSCFLRLRQGLFARYLLEGVKVYGFHRPGSPYRL